MIKFMAKLKISVIALILFTCYSHLSAQPEHYTTANAHAHNDYEHALPFYGAYTRHFGSIEADVWARKGKLFVAHARNQIKPHRTFQKLYLQPLLHRLKVNGGKPYKDGQPLQLLIDLKSPYYKVLPLLEQDLQPYKKYFDCKHNPNAVRIVISGNMPPADSLHLYDPIFTFDGRLGNHYPAEDLRRIKLVSVDVQNLVSWTKKKPLNQTQQNRLRHVTDRVHHKNKLIRFWATPNTSRAYKMLMKLGADYIGTDDPARLECMLRKEDPAAGNHRNWQKRSWSRHDTSYFFTKDSLSQKGYTLIFINKDSTFSSHVKKQLIKTFFIVYPKEAERFNRQTAKKVTFIMDPGYKGVAATSGAVTRFDPRWFKKHPKDIDVVTHEVMHIIQDYHSGHAPGWLTEGIADYARYTYGMNNKAADWTLPDYNPRQNYKDAYRVTARFLVWLQKNVSKNIVDKLNAILHSGTYTQDTWKKLTGKSVDELWKMYAKSPALDLHYH
jgi:hypothetical protein